MKFYKIKLLLSLIILLMVTTSCSSNCTSNLDVQALNKKANALMNSGDINGAISRLESINDLNPNFPQTNYNLGIAYYKKGNLDKALISLNRAIELNKNFADAYYSVGLIYEDISTKEINNISKNSEDTSKILEDLNKSKDNYTQYVKLAKDQTDIGTIKSKIVYLDSEIEKYNTKENR